MNTKRVLEICEDLSRVRPKHLTQHCQGLIGELGLTSQDIESIQLESHGENEEDFVVLRRKIVKAVHAKLRSLVFQIASDKGLVAVGKPLPIVGYWRGKSLVGVSSAGMYIIPKDERGVTKGTTHTDPLKNPTFLAMLA